MQKINVLIFPCGSENALEIHKSLHRSIHTNIFGASSIDDIGSLVYKNYIGNVPFIFDKSFNEYFINLIKTYKIDIIFATHDTVQEYLSQNNFNAYLVNGNKETNKITRNKKLTYELFKNFSWCPFIYDIETAIYPAISKPNLGQGAQGVYKCENKSELLLNTSKISDPVIMEYLPGQELTIDCFTDRNRKIISIQPRTREKVKAGISMKSCFYSLTSELKEIAKDINKKLIMRGPWFFQVKQNTDGQWKLLEVSSRTAGTMVAQRAKGVNLPLMAIQDYLCRELTTIPIPEIKKIERAIYTKPQFDFIFSTVYIDFDDTIISDNQVIIEAMAFLYNMKNQKKNVILITRHERDIYISLDKFSIPYGLFLKIIHITDNQPKSNFITIKDAIFIDNHFPERLDVFEKCKIPVFDVDYLEFLI